jgi:tetratricopeptide (TPR) repeat protein
VLCERQRRFTIDLPLHAAWLLEMKTRTLKSSVSSETLFRVAVAFLFVFFLHSVVRSDMSAQTPQTVPQIVEIRGTVHDAAGKPVAGAMVRVVQQNTGRIQEVATDASGSFILSEPAGFGYRVAAHGAGKHSTGAEVTLKLDSSPVNLVLNQEGDLPQPSMQGNDTMEFADQPSFTVAGVTDWTAVGGHGSDSVLRTSEDLTRATLSLKSEKSQAEPAQTASESQLEANLLRDPAGFTANHQLGSLYLHQEKYEQSVPLLLSAFRADPSNHQNEFDLAVAMKETGDVVKAREHVKHLLADQATAADHRLAGELDEKLNDPLDAVKEFEEAVRLDPSEQNYFEWGSELLYHRAVWQALDVFKTGAQAHPQSERMITALATALFAGARYDEAALRLCEASDLQPADSEPYLFMGKIELAAPNPLPCVDEKLARFVAQKPENADANYLYAMALLKRQTQDAATLEKIESLLTKAVALNDKCSDGYLQLGILAASHRDLAQAIAYYQKAIAANPQLSDAHYRLGVAYDRVGEHQKAVEEFRMHDETKKLEAEAIDRQRREVKQFVVVPGQPADSATKQ